MDVRDTRPDPVEVARPTTLARAPDRLSVHHDRPAPPGSGGVVRELTQLVLDCLELFGEVVPTTVTSCSELEQWQDRVLPGPGGDDHGGEDHGGDDHGGDDTVLVVVVPAATWALHLTGGPARPGRGVVVVCGDGPEAPSGAWPAVHHVTAVRPGELPGALGEALAGQTSTVVHVLPG